jgi:hypothetical protein
MKAAQRSRRQRVTAAKRTGRRQARILQQKQSDRRGARRARARTRQSRRGAAGKAIGAGLTGAAARRATRKAQRQRQRTARARARQRGRTARAQAKGAGGKWSAGSTAARWGGISDVTGSVVSAAAPLAGAAMGIPSEGLGGFDDGAVSGTMDDPYGAGDGYDSELPAEMGAGNWFTNQSTPVKIGIVAGAAGLAYMLLKPKKKKKKS